MGQIDELLPPTAYGMLQPLAMTLGVVVLLILSIPWLAIGVPLAAIYLFRLRYGVMSSLGGLVLGSFPCILCIADTSRAACAS